MVQDVPELLVKGSRSINADIKRSEDSPQPYVVLGREEIERSHAPNLQEFLKTRLPMNATSSSQSQISGVGWNFSSIDLRGLGSNQNTGADQWPTRARAHRERHHQSG